MKEQEIMPMVFGLIITMMIFIISIVYLMTVIHKLKRKQKELLEPQVRISDADLVEAIVTDKNEVQLLDGSKCSILFGFEIVNSTVFIKYYDNFRQMIVQMYRPYVGYVLSPLEDDEDMGVQALKFYPIEKVYIGVPGKTIVHGYLDDGLFVVVKVIEELDENIVGG